MEHLCLAVMACAWFVQAPVTQSLKPRQVFRDAHFPGGVLGLTFSPDGKLLVSVGRGDRLQVRDLASGRLVAGPLGCDCVAIHPDGKLVATSFDNMIELLDVSSAKPRKTLKGHTERVWALSFSSDGKLLASASSDKTVKLWDLATGQPRATLPHAADVFQVAFLKGDRFLVSGSDSFRLWDVASGKEKASLKTKANSEVIALAVTSDGKTVAFAVHDADGKPQQPQLLLWDVSTRRHRPGPEVGNHSVQSLAFSPDGKMLAVGMQSGRCVLYKVTDGKRNAVLGGHYGPPNGLTFSFDGSTLATGDCEGTIRLWDLMLQPKPSE
jgi:WD40 repeat protein